MKNLFLIFILAMSSQSFAVQTVFNTGDATIDFIREEFRNGKLPSDKDLKVGELVTTCRMYDRPGVRPGWDVSPIMNLQFSHYDGMIKLVDIYRNGTVKDPSGTIFVPSKTGLVNHRDEKENYEIRATAGGDLIFEYSYSVEDSHLGTPAVANPSFSVVYYIMCPNSTK